MGGNRSRADRATRVARASRAAADARGLVEELGDARRSDVYREDVEFAPEPEPGARDGRWGSSRRWVKPVSELYARGLSQLEIANELDISPGYVGQLVTQYGIVKGKRGAGGSKEGES